MEGSARGELALAVAWALCALSSPRIAGAQPFHFEDSLRDGTMGHSSGGTFGPDGWTVTAVDDRIWYALPRLTTGSIELTVANITPASLPLADHEIFAMYEDGYGIGEPIGYAPAFRANHYKMLVRIYGMPEPSRLGFMKMMWGMCPSGAPGYDACGCTSFFEEPFADPGAWTGAPARLRVEWADGHARLFRDGAEVVGVDWSDTALSFGPSELHMMIGSPRNDGGLSAMPIGARFSDLVIDGEMGPLATCPGSSMADAGPPIDAGMCGGPGAVLADATAASWETGVFPDASDLDVEGDPGAPSAVVYLRFPPVAGAVAHATLTVSTSAVASAGGGSGEVCRVDGTFDEATLTWATRPAVSTACSGGARSVGASETVTWDVTSLVAPGGDVVLAIVSGDPDGAHYFSRESGGCSLGPRLGVELAPALDGGSSDAGTSDSGVSSPMDAARSDGGSDAGRRDGAGLTAGCGCSAHRADVPRFAWLAFALIAVCLGRRKR